MPILSEARLYNLRDVASKSYDDARRELKRETFKKNSANRYDIFLSHRIDDAKIIYALKYILETFGFAVFVDWIDAPMISRSDVTSETAERLRSVMKQSDSLLYAQSRNSSSSKWMPWELGFSDGLHGKVGIIPITETETGSESFRGQEYLGIYPYITLTDDKQGLPKLWINRNVEKYTLLKHWLTGTGV